MPSNVAMEVPTHHGNGLDVKNSHKSCRKLVEKMKECQGQGDAEGVWMRSTDKATTTPVKGVVEGEIPGWVEGNLYRNGPGVLNIGDSWYHHVFDGLAVLHKFSIKDGEATYTSHILESDSYKKNTAANRIVVDEFGTRAYPDPCKTILQKFMSSFSPPKMDDMSDNCAVNVCYYGDQLYAMTETNKMHRVDPDTLKTIGDKTNISHYIAVNMATAHPHVGPDGTVYNMGTSFTGAKGPTYNVIKFPPKKHSSDGKIVTPFEQASVVATIPCQWKMRPCYFHSFSITDHYYILVEQPLGVSVPKLLTSHFSGKSYMEAMDWLPKEKTKFHVVQRSDGQLLKTVYQADTFFVFHSINAYEEDGHIIVDLCCFEDGAVVNQLWLENITNPSETFNKALQALPRRYILPLDIQVHKGEVDQNLVKLDGTKCTATRMKNGDIHCEPEALTQVGMECPRINYRFNGKKYRYTYGFAPIKGVNNGRLCKVDTVTGETLLWQLPNTQVSEPIFVERPGATDEDDGVVLASVLNHQEEKEVRMVMMDAKTFKQQALVTFKTHGVVTRDIHGVFARSCDTVHGL